MGEAELLRSMSRSTALPNIDACPISSGAMDWHVQYRKDGEDHLLRLPSPEEAIEAACRLIDDGHEVYGIGTGPLTNSIGVEEITRIYALGREQITHYRPTIG